MSMNRLAVKNVLANLVTGVVVLKRALFAPSASSHSKDTEAQQFTTFGSMEIVHAFGVGSARHRAGLPVIGRAIKSTEQTRLFDMPIGTCVARWDIDKHKIIRFQQLHDDLVTCMIRSSVGTIATCSYAGEVSLWSSEWDLLGSIRMPSGRVLHASWSSDGRQLAVTCRLEGGALVIVDAVAAAGPRILCTLPGEFDFVEWTPSGRVWAVEQNERPLDPCTVVLATLEHVPTGAGGTGVELRAQRMPLADTHVRMCASDGAGRVALALADRTLRLMDMESQRIDWVFAGGPAGSVQTMLFDRGVVTLPMGGGKLGAFVEGRDEPLLIRCVPSP
jgi:hypothetical protein